MRPLFGMLILLPSLLGLACPLHAGNESEVTQSQQREQLIAGFATGIDVDVNLQVEDPIVTGLVRRIADNYKVPPSMAARIVEFAQDNSDPVFPKREDILAVIAVESRFQPSVELAGSVGLMGIRYKSHKLTKKQVLDIETNISYGASYLKLMYSMFGSTVAALQAFNVGPYAYKNGSRNAEYLKLFTRHRNKINP